MQFGRTDWAATMHGQLLRHSITDTIWMTHQMAQAAQSESTWSRHCVCAYEWSCVVLEKSEWVCDYTISLCGSGIEASCKNLRLGHFRCGFSENHICRLFTRKLALKTSQNQVQIVFKVLDIVAIRKFLVQTQRKASDLAEKKSCEKKSFLVTTVLFKVVVWRGIYQIFILKKR